MKRFLSIVSLLFWMPFCFGENRATCQENILYCPWIVYYADKAPPGAFLSYNPIVFDSESHPPLEILQKEHKSLFAYINLGEVETRSKVFAKASESGLLIRENPDWPGSHLVDMRKREWFDLILNVVIPPLLQEGFNGIFLDTLDNPIELEREDPEKSAGMRKAAAQLVQLIRIYYPDVTLMMNRAFELLPEVGNAINIVLGESLYTDYNFKTKTYGQVPEGTFQANVLKLKKAQKTFKHLQVFSLDYWDPKDTETVAKIYAIERENGFRPYVSVIGLDEVLPEPQITKMVKET